MHGQAEVCDAKVARLGDEDILRLEVAEADVILVQVLEGEQELSRVEARRLFRHFLLRDLLQQPEEVPALFVVKHEEDPSVVLECEMAGVRTMIRSAIE